MQTASTRVHHNVNSGTTTIASRNEYDHMGRRLTTHETINNDPEVLLVSNIYNEIGQLKGKDLDNGKQHTDYTYNERGWLKNSTSNQFSFQLKYQDGTTPQYNGNISGQNWGTGNTLNNSFVYGYDHLDRLSSGVGTGMSEILTYDVMGNIQSVKRDNSNWGYEYNGNQLSKTSGDLATATYSYDYNGNSTFDGRQNQIVFYNYLNLPASIPGLNLSYVYDASGNKLRKISNGVTTDYIDGIQYNNGTIEFIQTEIGLARRNGTSYSYEYNLMDHLGNVRYTFNDNPASGLIERLQSDDYYPFGLRKSSGSSVSLNNNTYTMERNYKKS